MVYKSLSALGQLNNACRLKRSWWLFDESADALYLCPLNDTYIGSDYWQGE